MNYDQKIKEIKAYIDFLMQLAEKHRQNRKTKALSDVNMMIEQNKAYVNQLIKDQVNARQFNSLIFSL